MSSKFINKSSRFMTTLIYFLLIFLIKLPLQRQWLKNMRLNLIFYFWLILHLQRLQPSRHPQIILNKRQINLPLLFPPPNQQQLKIKQRRNQRIHHILDSVQHPFTIDILFTYFIKLLHLVYKLIILLI